MNLSDLDFAEGQPTQKLTLTDGAVFVGNTAELFQPAEPFPFIEAPVA